MDMTVTNSRCKRLVSRAVVYLGHVQAQPAYSHGFKWRELSLTNLSCFFKSCQLQYKDDDEC